MNNDDLPKAYPLALYVPPYYTRLHKEKLLREALFLLKRYSSMTSGVENVLNKIMKERFPDLYAKLKSYLHQLTLLKAAATAIKHSESDGFKESEGKWNVTGLNSNILDILSSSPDFSMLSRQRLSTMYKKLSSLLHPDKKRYKKLGFSMLQAQEYLHVAKMLRDSGDMKGLFFLWLLVNRSADPRLSNISSLVNIAEDGSLNYFTPWCYDPLSEIKRTNMFLERIVFETFNKITKLQTTNGFYVLSKTISGAPKEVIHDTVELILREKIQDLIREIHGLEIDPKTGQVRKTESTQPSATENV